MLCLNLGPAVQKHRSGAVTGQLAHWFRHTEREPCSVTDNPTITGSAALISAIDFLPVLINTVTAVLDSNSKNLPLSPGLVQTSGVFSESSS